MFKQTNKIIHRFFVLFCKPPFFMEKVRCCHKQTILSKVFVKGYRSTEGNCLQTGLGTLWDPCVSVYRRDRASYDLDPSTTPSFSKVTSGPCDITWYSRGSPVSVERPPWTHSVLDPLLIPSEYLLHCTRSPPYFLVCLFTPIPTKCDSLVDHIL